MGKKTLWLFVCVCIRVCAGIICRRTECSVIFSTYSDCFPALLLWCLTLLFALPIYFGQRVTLYCSPPARLFSRVTEQERIHPSLPNSHLTDGFPSTFSLFSPLNTLLFPPSSISSSFFLSTSTVSCCFSSSFLLSSYFYLILFPLPPALDL